VVAERKANIKKSPVRHMRTVDHDKRHLTVASTNGKKPVIKEKNHGGSRLKGEKGEQNGRPGRNTGGGQTARQIIPKRKGGKPGRKKKKHQDLKRGEAR